jgi:hypothetical protein
MSEITIFKQTTDKVFEENENPVGLTRNQFLELNELKQSIEQIPTSSFLPIRLQYLLPYVSIATTLNQDAFNIVVTCDKITRISRDGIPMYASPGETILVVGWDDTNVQKKWFSKSSEPCTLLTQNIDPLILAHLGSYTLTDRYTTWKYMTANVFSKPAFIPNKVIRFRNKEHAEDEINRMIRYCSIITSSYELLYQQLITEMNDLTKDTFSTRMIPSTQPIPFDTSNVAKTLNLNNTTDSIISILSHNLLIWDTGRLLGVEHKLFQEFVKKIKSEKLSEQKIRETTNEQIKSDSETAKLNYICLARFNITYDKATQTQKATVLKTIQNIEKNVNKMPEEIRQVLHVMRQNLHNRKDLLEESFHKLVALTNWKPESPEGYYNHVCAHLMVQAYQMVKFNNISLIKIAHEYGILDSAWYCKTCGELIAEDIRTDHNIDWDTAHLTPERDALSDTIWRTVIICIGSIITIPTVPSQKLTKEINQIIYPVVQNYQTKLARNRTINQEKKANTLSLIIQTYAVACIMGFAINLNLDVVIKDGVSGGARKGQHSNSNSNSNKNGQSQNIGKLYHSLFKKNNAMLRKLGYADDYLKSLFLEAMKFAMTNQIIIVQDDIVELNSYIIDPIISWAQSYNIPYVPDKSQEEEANVKKSSSKNKEDSSKDKIIYDYLAQYYKHVKKISPAFETALNYFDVCRNNSVSSVELKKAEDLCITTAEEEMKKIQIHDYKRNRPYGRFSEDVWSRQHNVPILQHYQRYCLDTGIPHKFWGVLWKNGERTTKQPIPWDKRKNNFPVKEFCVHCNYELNQLFPEAQANEMNEKIKSILIEKDDISAFFQYYESRCPDNIFHRFKSDNCEYCQVSLDELTTMNKEYYLKKLNIWKVQKKQTQELNQMKRSAIATHPIPSVNLSQHDKKQPIPPYVETATELTELVRWSKINKNFFENIGLLENVHIYEIENNLVNPSRNEDVDVIWQSRVIESYILHIIQLIQSWFHKVPVKYTIDISKLQTINLNYWGEKEERISQGLKNKQFVFWHLHILSSLLNRIHKISHVAAGDIVEWIYTCELALTSIGTIEEANASNVSSLNTDFTQESDNTNMDEDDAFIDDVNFGYGELDVDETLIESNIED